MRQQTVDRFVAHPPFFTFRNGSLDSVGSSAFGVSGALYDALLPTRCGT